VCTTKYTLPVSYVITDYMRKSQLCKSLRQLKLHSAVTASLNTKFCRPSKIIFSHISKFRFVYVFRFLDDRPQYGGAHKDFQRVEVQTRFVASESNFPPQQTFVSDPVCVVAAIQLRRYLGKKFFFSENQCYFPLSVSSLLKLHKWQYNGKVLVIKPTRCISFSNLFLK